MRREAAEGSGPGGFARAVKGGLVIFALVLFGIALLAWLGSDLSPIAYDGFD